MPASPPRTPARFIQSQAREPDRSALDRIDRLMKSAEIVNNALPWLEGVGLKVLALSKLVDKTVDQHPEAALASIHMVHGHRHSSAYSVHMAMLSSLVSRHLGYDDERRLLIVAAALSCNASIIKLQNELHVQTTKPTPAQMIEVREHAHRTAELLRRTGVDDRLWLDIVVQHHERPDGSGYPAHLLQDDIADEALIVGLADRYVAGVSHRPHAPARPPDRCIVAVFKDPSLLDYKPMVRAFLEELTPYPPGSFVRLHTDREGVVVNRPRGTGFPEVALLPLDDRPWSPQPPALIDPELIARNEAARPLDPAYRQLWPPQ